MKNITKSGRLLLFYLYFLIVTSFKLPNHNDGVNLNNPSFSGRKILTKYKRNKETITRILFIDF